MGEGGVHSGCEKKHKGILKSKLCKVKGEFIRYFSNWTLLDKVPELLPCPNFYFLVHLVSFPEAILLPGGERLTALLRFFSKGSIQDPLKQQ